MYPKDHFIIGILFCVILFFIIPQISFLGLSLIFASSILIDSDHYFWFIFNFKNFNLKKAYLYAKNNKSKKNRKKLMIFHTIEFLILILILSHFLKFLIYVFIGSVFHILIDTIDLVFKIRKNKKSKRYISLIYYFIILRKLKKFNIKKI